MPRSQRQPGARDEGFQAQPGWHAVPPWCRHVWLAGGKRAARAPWLRRAVVVQGAADRGHGQGWWLWAQAAGDALAGCRGGPAQAWQLTGRQQGWLGRMGSRIHALRPRLRKGDSGGERNTLASSGHAASAGSSGPGGSGAGLYSAFSASFKIDLAGLTSDLVPIQQWVGMRLHPLQWLRLLQQPWVPSGQRRRQLLQMLPTAHSSCWTCLIRRLCCTALACRKSLW